MKKYTLKAEPRAVVGRKVKAIRRQGQLPATVYGKKIQSQSATVSTSDFAKVYREAGETGLVELSLGRGTRPVLIHNVQMHPVTGQPLHVEFFQVDLKEKVHARVPLEFVGESPVVANRQGVLLVLLDEVDVEALPTDLPDKIEVDVAGLSEVDKELNVRDLTVPAGVTVVTDSAIPVVKVGPLVSKEAQEQAEAEAAAAAEAAEAAEGAAPAEGKASAPEETPPQKPQKDESETAS